MIYSPPALKGQPATMMTRADVEFRLETPPPANSADRPITD
jgi:hypothetical protein